MFIKNNNSYKWVVLGISFILMLTFAISLQSLPPLFKKIQMDISFTNSQAGMLMGAYAIPGIFLPFLIAYLASKYNKVYYTYRLINFNYWTNSFFYVRGILLITNI